jgi:3-hydroxyisobutyrate dehydrogenase-like beta-hydroxyacid dehydrogenase
MGRPMALNLLKRGFKLVVHSRSPGPVDELVAAGAERANSPAEVARRARRIVTMLPDSPDVSKVLEGPDGVFSALQPGTLLIDCSTIAPAEARRLAARAKALGAAMLDAPVSGGEIGAINASLSIMVGGDAGTFEQARPIFDAMGNPERVVLIGPSGSGQICKVCNQLVIGGALAAVGEAFGLARKAGVDAAKVRAALLGGFASSRVLEVHGERILQENYKPGFRAVLYQKDMRIAAQTLAEHKAQAPITTLMKDLVDKFVGQGRGEEDYSAVATLLVND